MKTYCLASSSAGNCYILEFEIEGRPTRIMVECGLPIKTIFKRLNEYGILLSSIKCCLITHAHGDHCCAAKDIAKYMPVYAHNRTLEISGVHGYALVESKPNRLLKGLYCLPFPVEHDIDGAVGFVIKTQTETVIFVNDHKRWTSNLGGFKPNYVFIECNYMNKIVYAQLNDLRHQLKTNDLNDIEKTRAENKIKQHERNLNSHCSLTGTIKGLSKLNLNNCIAIFLMHLSDRFANEYKMKSEVQIKTKIQTFVCGKNGGIK